MTEQKTTINTTSKDARSLLLYVEARAVDFGGRMNAPQLNEQDRRTLEEWNAAGFVLSGRIVVADHNNDGSLWCWLSPEAFKLAQAERRARARLVWEQERFETTASKRHEETDGREGFTRPVYAPE